MITVYNLAKGQEDIFIINVNTGVEKINILLDGGNSGTRCIDRVRKMNIGKIDYIILTHIDQDHIKGLLKLLKINEKCKDAIIVYNKFINGLISYSQAEDFEKLIECREIIVSYKEYQNNSGNIIFLSVSQRMKLQKKEERVYITFLGPTKDKVEKLYEYYKYYKANNETEKSDNSKIVNRSSIMFILEYKNFAILMTGDGYISDIILSVDKLFDKSITAYPVSKLNLIKIPHHGSKENNKKLGELLNKTSCDTIIITNSDDGNVKIDNKIIETLKNKTVYVSKNSNKYEGLDLVEKYDIEIG